MPAHTDKQFEEDLQQLKELILKMGGVVEEMVASSMEALVKRDTHMAEEVQKRDRMVNKMEMEIDDLCLRLLALHQPAARDLRFVEMGFKISTDLERMGDLAVNICEQAIDLNKDEPLKPYVELPLMAQKAQRMLHEALNTFVSKDVERAQAVCEMDDEVDEIGHKIFDEVVQLISDNPGGARRGVRIIIVSRQLERIADHATNIAEEVIFLVQGKDMRHGA